MNETVAMDEPVVEAPGETEFEAGPEFPSKSTPKSEVASEGQAVVEPGPVEKANGESIPDSTPSGDVPIQQNGEVSEVPESNPGQNGVSESTIQSQPIAPELENNAVTEVEPSDSAPEELSKIPQAPDQIDPDPWQPNDVSVKPESDQVKDIPEPGAKQEPGPIKTQPEPVKTLTKPEPIKISTQPESDPKESKPEQEQIEVEQGSGPSESKPEPDVLISKGRETSSSAETSPVQPVCIRITKTPSPVPESVVEGPPTEEEAPVASGSSSGDEVIQPEPETSSQEVSNSGDSVNVVEVKMDDGEVKEADQQSSSTVEALHRQAELVKCNANELIQRLDEIDPGHKLRSLCKKGDTVALEEFIMTGGVDLDVVSDEGWTCLHEIITHECQFTEVARILMAHGANVNTQDLHGDSPLHSCLLYHCTENIQLLLSHGADLDLTNGSGRKPIHVANDEESLKLLLEHGADVNVADNMGNTCLHYAVVAKDKDRVKLLLSPKYNSDVTVRNASGSTPLHLATDPEIASMLLEASADPNAVDQVGNSPLHLAVRGRHKEVVRYLMEKKADPNIINSNGKLPAALARDKEMKNILAGKISSPSISNGVTLSAAINVTPTAIASRKRAYSPSVASAETPTSAATAIGTPSSILKKVRRVSNENGERTSRLRFSDVNEYNCIDGDGESLAKRVKVRPIYSEPTFSSDDEF